MANVKLTPGAIPAIANNAVDKDVMPILQVTDLKPVMTSQNMAERYRTMLSDGIYTLQAMLATQMNPLVKEGRLHKGSIVQLEEFLCNIIQNRKIIIVLKMSVVVEACEVIGDPRIYDINSSAAFDQSRASIPPSGAQAPESDANRQSNANSAGSMSGQSVVTGMHSNPGMHANPMMERTSTNASSGHNMLSSGASIPSYNNNTMYPRTNTESRMQNLNNQRVPNAGVSAPLHSSTNAYGRSIPSPYQQPQQPPVYQNRGPIAKNEVPARIIPIAALNPYQGRWTIKARVTTKGDLRRYNNPRGDGKVFSFDLLDSEGGEIRVTCFNNEADQFYNQVEVGKVYMISRGSLKPAQKKFNHLNNDYEVFLESTSMIQPCPDDGSIAKQLFNFRPISEIEVTENNSIVDVIGVVSSINPSVTIMTKSGNEALKRALTLKDMSGRSVEVTIWGNFCNTEGQHLQNMCDSGAHPVLAIKSCRVNDFSGKSIGTLSSSQLYVDPDFTEAHRLREWYGKEGKSASVVSISREMTSMGRTDSRKTISQIKDESLGRSEKPDWITVKASISFMKSDNFCYTACPLMLGDRQCNKKVNNNGDGNWHCDRCEQSFPECDYRYILQLQIQDHSGLTWVTAFQESGEEILGISAKELCLLKYEEQDDAKFAEVIRRVLFNQYLFKLKIKEETFSDEQRIKSTVVKAEKIIPSSESKYLLGVIDQLMGEESPAASGRIGVAKSEYGVSSVGYNNQENSYVKNTTASHLAGQYPNEYGSITGHGNDGIISRRTQQAACTQCGSMGHGPQNCPMSTASMMQGQAMGAGYVNRTSYSGSANVNTGNMSTSNCYKCQQPGHWARDCPGSNAPPSGSAHMSTGSMNTSNCYKCQQPGHWARDCPGSNTTPSYGNANYRY